MQPYNPKAPSKAETLIAALRTNADALCQSAADEIERLRAQEFKLARRIHQQRLALRENWQIVEMRKKYWQGSQVGRKAYLNLLTRHQRLIREISGEKDTRPFWRRLLAPQS